ncbi:hypothetical protein AV530_004114 [Patagioenas fasciata monilis]|uniref:Uncharacterized protein n=1 Tax=Patagioenas fasciata monilis TaxID=372326 RepID=A0A1V4JR73_PATFA|nr:hypothetical protein AV530_004114 [Patagioenas fasciata monilis]
MLGQRGEPNQRCPLNALGHVGGNLRLNFAPDFSSSSHRAVQDFKMTGREFLEVDTPQQRLFLERFKRMEIIQKIFNELPKADQLQRE